MRKLVTSANYVKLPGEVNNGVSDTVPEMTIPLKVLLDKYTRGQPLPPSRFGFPYYEGEEEVPDYHSLDLVDIQEIVENGKEVLEDVKRAAEFKKQQERESAKSKDFEKSVEPGVDV